MWHINFNIVCRRSRSHLEVKGQTLWFLPCPSHNFTCCLCIIMILCRNVHSDIYRRVTYKLQHCMSKVKVTHRGQRSNVCGLYLFRAITSHVIYVSSWYFVEMFTLIYRSVTYKFQHCMSKVKVTLRGQRSNFVVFTLSEP